MLNAYQDSGVKKPLDVWVRKRKAADGERYSVLVTGSGAPLFYPNVFLTSMRRAVGLAANSLNRDAQALAHLLVWADRAGIDLDERFAAGAFLTPTEVLSYAREAKRHLTAVRAKPPQGVPVGSLSLGSAGVERLRAKPTPAERVVGKTHAEFRIWLADRYLDWLVDAREPRSLSQDELEHREHTRQYATTYLNASVALPMPMEGEAIVRYLADSPIVRRIVRISRDADFKTAHVDVFSLLLEHLTLSWACAQQELDQRLIAYTDKSVWPRVLR